MSVIVEKAYRLTGRIRPRHRGAARTCSSPGADWLSSPSMAPPPSSASWTIDPADPRAPPLDVWERLSSAGRQRIVAALPSEFPISEANPPEGDAHFNTKARTKDTLDGFFTRVGRRVYLPSALPTYYPGERVFAPDVFAVIDVDRHERERWVVADEGRGLGVAFEILVSGSKLKDLRDNVTRYARLGIPEYFVFDRGRLRLHGCRLPSPTARVYEPILPQGGRYHSQQLGLELRVEENRLRFFVGSSPVPEAHELVSSLERMIDDVEKRAETEARLREEEARLREEETRLRAEEARLREEETRRRESAEAQLAAALAEIDRLRGRQGG